MPFSETQLNDEKFLKELQPHEFRIIPSINHLLALILATELEKNEELLQILLSVNVEELITEFNEDFADLLSLLLNMQYARVSLDKCQIVEKISLLKESELTDKCISMLALLLTKAFSEEFSEFLLITISENAAESLKARISVKCLEEYIKMFKVNIITELIDLRLEKEDYFSSILSILLSQEIEIPELMQNYFENEIVNDSDTSVIIMNELVNEAQNSYSEVDSYTLSVVNKLNAETFQNLLSLLKERKDQTLYNEIELLCTKNSDELLLLLNNNASNDNDEGQMVLLLKCLCDKDQTIRKKSISKMHEFSTELQIKDIYDIVIEYNDDDYELFLKELNKHFESLRHIFEEQDLNKLVFYCEHLEEKYLKLQSSKFYFLNDKEIAQMPAPFKYAIEYEIDNQNQLLELDDIENDVFTLALLEKQSEALSLNRYNQIVGAVIENLQKDDYFLEDLYFVDNKIKQFDSKVYYLFLVKQLSNNVSIDANAAERRNTLALSDLQQSTTNYVDIDFASFENTKKLSLPNKNLLFLILSNQKYDGNDSFEDLSAECANLLLFPAEENQLLHKLEELILANGKIRRSFESDEGQLQKILLVVETILMLTEKSASKHLPTNAIYYILAAALSDFEVKNSEFVLINEQSFSVLGSQIINILLHQIEQNEELPKSITILIIFIAFIKNKLIKHDKQELFSCLQIKSIKEIENLILQYNSQYTELYNKNQEKVKYEQLLPGYEIYYLIYELTAILPTFSCNNELLANEVVDYCFSEFKALCLAEESEVDFCISAVEKLKQKTVLALNEAIYSMILKRMEENVEELTQKEKISVSYPGALFEPK